MWGKNGKLSFNGYGILVWDNKKSFADSGDICTIMWMYLTTLSYTHKNNKMVNFMLCICAYFTTIFIESSFL